MSVGNLPPHATVIIKVTYVAELQVEGENIVFSIPGSVAPWKETGALDDVTQVSQLLAPAVTRGETEGAMDSTSVFFWPFLLPITL